MRVLGMRSICFLLAGICVVSPYSARAQKDSLAALLRWDGIAGTTFTAMWMMLR